MSANQIYTEQELLQRTAEGDERAFENLFSAYYSLLKPFVWKFSVIEADREEIIQETFVRIWLHREQLPVIENIRAWIFTIASRVAYAQLRRQFREERKLTAFRGESITANADFATPLLLMHSAEVAQLIQGAVKTLSPQQKLIFRMSREQQLKPAQIARELNLSVQTVSNTLTTVLKKIRVYLGNAGYDLSLLFLCSFFLV